jgi:hypothetical protein
VTRFNAKRKVAGIVDDIPDSGVTTSVEDKSHVEGSNILSPPDVKVKAADVLASTQKQQATDSGDGTERSFPSEIVERDGQQDSQSGENFDWKKIGRGAILNKLKPTAF